MVIKKPAMANQTTSGAGLTPVCWLEVMQRSLGGKREFEECINLSRAKDIRWCMQAGFDGSVAIAGDWMGKRLDHSEAASSFGGEKKNGLHAGAVPNGQ